MKRPPRGSGSSAEASKFRDTPAGTEPPRDGKKAEGVVDTADLDSASEAATLTRRQVLASLAVGVGGLLAGCGGTGTPGPGTGGDTDGTDGSPTEATPSEFGPAPEVIGPWPQARADAGNTGSVDASGPAPAPSLRWTTDSAGTVGAAVGAATVVQGDSSVSDSGDGDARNATAGPFVVGEDGRVAALDSAGDARWRTTVGDGQFPPAAGAGFVVVPQREGLVVFDAASGERLRSIELPGGVLYAPTLDGTRALVGTFSNGVVAVDVESGETRWQDGDPSRAYPPIVADGVAYVTARRWETDDGGDAPGVLAALDAETGDRLWELSLDGPPTAPPGHHDGVVYAGTNQGSVFGVDAESGDRIWREAVGDWVTRGPTAGADGVYAVVLGAGPVKLDHDGAVSWRSDVGGGTNPVLTADDVVLGTDDGVVAVGRDDGELSWRGDTDAAVQFDVRLRDGVVYAGDQYGTVWAFDASTGERRWEFPFRPATMPGPVVGPRTVAGGSLDGGTYDVLASQGQELSLVGGAATPAITPVFLRDETGGSGSEAGGEGSAASPTRTEGRGGSPAIETLLGGGSDGSLFRVRTVDYGEPPGDGLRPTPTPTATPEPGEPTRTPTPHIDLPETEPLWERELDVRPRSPVTYADGRAYLGTDEGLAAVDPRNGQLLWQLSLEGNDGDANDGDGLVSGAPAVSEGRVFVATDAGRLVAVDPGEDSTDGDAGEGSTDGDSGEGTSSDGAGDSESGSGVARPGIEWEVSLDGAARAGPVAVDESVFVADESGRVAAHDVAGERRWRRDVGDAVFGGPSVIDDRVFVGTEAGEVVALRRSDGSVSWRNPTDGEVRATPAIGGETVYVGDHGGTLWAFDAANGDVRWQLSIGRWVDSPPAVGHGAVFVADQTGNVYAIVGE
ncbi:PQQ-binding-like beta-propeller repeat protein [Halobellus rarus]|uniref:PQQ-binding-like beta-propeller repeat protein n=1 Tax=Halobellus rarus TaxID=1126237 RepID=A0ABD6CRD1_9EURY|nr:PQQ-binding-like beta-propeller repeat protein [Halobellus rarus]